MFRPAETLEHMFPGAAFTVGDAARMPSHVAAPAVSPLRKAPGGGGDGGLAALLAGMEGLRVSGGGGGGGGGGGSSSWTCDHCTLVNVAGTSCSVCGTAKGGRGGGGGGGGRAGGGGGGGGSWACHNCTLVNPGGAASCSLCGSASGGGGGGGAPPTPFAAAFRGDVEPETGGWADVSATVKRKVSALTRGARSMWIGIASRGREGARGRWDAKYKALGMRHFALVYETSSDHFRKAMEAELTAFYGIKSQGGFLDNVVEGGGGGHGSPPYVVYLAWA